MPETTHDPIHPGGIGAENPEVLAANEARLAAASPVPVAPEEVAPTASTEVQI